MPFSRSSTARRALHQRTGRALAHQRRRFFAGAGVVRLVKDLKSADRDPAVRGDAADLFRVADKDRIGDPGPVRCIYRPQRVRVVRRRDCDRAFFSGDRREQLVHCSDHLRLLSAYGHDPAEGVLDPPPLDTGQRIVEQLRDRANLPGADLIDLLPIGQPADG